MPIYEYRCKECGRERDSLARDDPQPCLCGGISRRVFSVNVTGNAFVPHFNHSVGAHVNSSRHFDDLLKRRAEENTIATGIEHNYSRIDPDEAKSVKALGVNDDGVEQSKRKRRAEGLDQPSTTKVVY